MSIIILHVTVARLQFGVSMKGYIWTAVRDGVLRVSRIDPTVIVVNTMIPGGER